VPFSPKPLRLLPRMKKGEQGRFTAVSKPAIHGIRPAQNLPEPSRPVSA
jgi:hypothetical protein